MLKLWGFFTTMFWTIRNQPRLEQAMNSGDTTALVQISKESILRVLEKQLPGNILDDFNPTRVEFPAACGVKEIGNSIPDTPLLAAG